MKGPSRSCGAHLNTFAGVYDFLEGLQAGMAHDGTSRKSLNGGTNPAELISCELKVSLAQRLHQNVRAT